MELTVLGCAGSFPGPAGPCSAYLVEHAGFRLLVDFGTGALGTLQRCGDMYAVDAIVLSHLHADHVLDAASYVVARRWAPHGPLPPVPLLGPAGTPERLARAEGGARDLDDVYTFARLLPGTVSLGPFELTAARMAHPVETYGLRLSAGDRTLAYSADTGPCDALAQLAAGADAFLCEASFLDDDPANPPDLHLTGGQAGQYAAKAGAGRLLLTHLVSAWGSEAATLAAARSSFDGPTEVVRLGARYRV